MLLPTDQRVVLLHFHFGEPTPLYGIARRTAPVPAAATPSESGGARRGGPILDRPEWPPAWAEHVSRMVSGS